MQKDIYQEFIDKMTKAMSKVSYRNLLKEKVDMRTLVSKVSLDNVDKMVKSAINCGAKVTIDGKASSNTNEYYYEPII